MDMLLKLLEENARLSLEQLASLTGRTQKEVADTLDELKDKGVIAGYQAIVDWEKAGSEEVSSLIEVRITPKRDFGFDEFAATISRFPEVESVYLMSGGYDISIEVKGKSFRDIAMFVAKRLSPMESVLSTATHFVLKKYKERGVIFCDAQIDERGIATL
ncbi:MAG: Lrp/AsnC family transcriptional regulator [Oscillospiraceae bacterium]